MDPSRRSFLKTSSATAGLYLARPAALFGAMAPQWSQHPSGALKPFPLASVRLSSGIFSQQAEINARYLDSLQVDRLLHTFRLTAGFTSNAEPYGGWEEPGCELRGHFAGGHYLSAVAMAYGSAGNTDLRRKGDALVAGLYACQKKMGSSYLGAFPAGLFEHLAQGKPVWAPFYTYHKIMAGLLDMYQLTGNQDALAAVEGMAHWAQDFMSSFSVEQQQRMLRTEYGGMNEVLANLAAATQKERYLDAAHLFEQPGFLDPLAARRDELEGLHANTNVPKIIGAARMYEVTGQRRYREIAEYFLEEVLAARTYAIGNTSLDEHWTTGPDHLQGSLGWTNAECCVAYNLMKLQRQVFTWSADPRWMDAYEQTLFNCRLGTQNAQGLKQYFFPLAAGYWRAYNSPEHSFWCCTGTGAEDFAKFTDTIYFHRGADLYVNQFLASTLDWKDEGFGLEQVTRFPLEQATTLKIKASRALARTIHLRIPAWTNGGALVTINGRPLEAIADPGSYLALHRVWQDGDSISLSLPMALRQDPLPGDNSIVSASYGPLVLAADLGAGPSTGPSRIVSGRDTEPKDLPAAAALPQVVASSDAAAADWVRTTSSPNLRFSVEGQTANYPLLPMYQVTDQKYSVYWQREREQAKA